MENSNRKAPKAPKAIAPVAASKSGAIIATDESTKVTTLTLPSGRVIESASAITDTNWRDAVSLQGGITASMGETSGSIWKDGVKQKGSKPKRATVTFRDSEGNRLTMMEAQAAKLIAEAGKAKVAYDETGNPISATEARAKAAAGATIFVDVLECCDQIESAERKAPATPDGFGQVIIL